MGRKSQSKQNPKKISSKENNKFEQQKRKELAVLTDKLLKLTSVFQHFTLNKSWEHHLEIESILKQIQNIESSKIISGQKPREACLQAFTKWLNENDVEYEGVEISSFEGYDLGLKATKVFKEGDLILTVPQKIMMSEDTAKESQLAQFIAIDPLLQNMPNITLAFYLLLEKNKADSFWKPYIDILPRKYSTVLYFTSEELEELKPSPVFESSLKLCRSIARQYSYFYNKVHTLDIPVLKDLQEVFTYENYRWAVSTVMTRQNNIKFTETDATAFIPLWDMCNHEHGKITTDLNKEKNRGECYALKDLQPGEQIFIFYGSRPNSDLFLHNGFIYPNNEYDSLSLALGISTSDKLKDKRLQLLANLGLASVTHYTLYKHDIPVSAEMLAFIRVFNMNDEELTKWLEKGIPSDLVSSEESSASIIGTEIDLKAYKYLLVRCNLLTKLYEKSEIKDTSTVISKNIQLLKESEVQVLNGAIKYVQTMIDKLTQGNVDK